MVVRGGNSGRRSPNRGDAVTPQTVWITPPTQPIAEMKKRGPVPGAVVQKADKVRTPRGPSKAAQQIRELREELAGLQKELAETAALRAERDRFFENWATERSKRESLERQLKPLTAEAKKPLAKMVETFCNRYTRLANAADSARLNGDAYTRKRLERQRLKQDFVKALLLRDAQP